MATIFDKGGMLGTTLYFNDDEFYVASGNGSPSYVGGRIQEFAGTTSNVTVSLTSLTGGLASAPAENDIVIVAFATNPDDTNQISYRISGYTEIADLYSLDTEQVQLQVGYKIMGATPDTSLTITGGTADVDQAGVVAVHVWRGVDLSTPFDVSSTTVTQTNTALPNPPAITPVTQGAMVVVIGAGGHNDAISGVEIKFNANESELTNFLTSGPNDTHDVTLGMGSFKWYQGEFDPSPFTFAKNPGTDSTAFAAAAVTLALRPDGTLGNKKNSGIWSLSAASRPTKAFNVEYLVIAGGAGGGNGNGGGGGAGGYRTGTLSVRPSVSYTATVGAGGARETVADATGNAGSNSVFSSITSTGGGGGAGDAADDGANGGSGGGGRGYRSGSGGTGIVGQGNDGGDGSNTSGSIFGSGGGGGAGSAGQNGTSLKGGNGGSGSSSSITGTSVARAGGGGGGSEGTSVSTVGTGTAGGGTGGANFTNGYATDGQPGTGGGGGGGGWNLDRGIGAAGGSGIVILKYPIEYNILLSAGHTGYTIKPTSTHKVTVISGGTGNVSWS